jgi:hypothetical protein
MVNYRFPEKIYAEGTVVRHSSEKVAIIIFVKKNFILNFNFNLYNDVF